MLRRPPPPNTAASLAAAKSAGLRYVRDDAPGIVRSGAAPVFRYRTPEGGMVRASETLARIKRLAIPPAWTQVWICPHANGHIQAVGRDVRGRKQYRYHADWRAVRDENKYARILAFGRALPKIRDRVARDLARRDLGREKILAAMVRLLETTLIRVGNEEYARANGSTGLSTLRDRHVHIEGGTLRFDFVGKSGKPHRITLRDPRLARIVRRAQELPGQELFQYLDADGHRTKVHSEDVNAYLRAIAGEEFSAKDFRTWAGTVLAAMALGGLPRNGTKAETKRNLNRAIENVAKKLGNTPAICRKCYIHPAIVESYLASPAIVVWRAKTPDIATWNVTFRRAEEKVLRFLEKCLRAPQPTLISKLRRSIVQTRRPRKRRSVRVGADAAGEATRSPPRKSRPSKRRSRQ